MTPATAAATPPDLTQCDREPIHLLGQVQPWGFLLSADDTETIRHASANVAAHLGEPAEALIGRGLDTLLQSEALHEIRARLQGLQGQHQTDRIFALLLIAGQPPYDVALHLTPGEPSLFVLEAEPSVAEPGFDALTTVKGMMARLLQAADLPSLHDRAARQLRSVLGYDRVMVYRFETDGSGEVVGEAAAAGLESFRGLHYPASDIPAQARALYCRNWLRLIADIGAPTVDILPPGMPPLDLSSSVLRSVSPVHIEYLRNMGVVASLSISIMRGDQLWGLLACHHNRPLLPSFARRSAAELFGQLYSFQVESRERAEAAAHDRSARAMLQRVVAVLAGDADLGERLQRLASEVRELMPCDGVAIRNAGRIELIGATPDAALLGDILDALGRAEPAQAFVTTEIARLHPAAGANAPAVVGMLAIPISHTRQDYLAFFRAEKIHSVTWAGNPDKPVQPGVRQSPRQSFEAWRQTVRGQSAAWSEAELRSAEALRVAMLEAVLRQLGRTVDEQHRTATDRQDLLINELNHRVRNVLGLIRALVARSLTFATTLEGFVIALNGRIQALARAHDQLTEDHWGPVALRGMIESELYAYHSARGPSRAVVSGSPVLVEPQALTVLALVVHELATNAVKYGALSGDHGIVTVSWRLKDDGALAITWQETGGPLVAPPARSGFGTTVIGRTIPFELGGEAGVRYAPGGVEAEFTIPARFVHPGRPDDPPVAPTPARRKVALQVAGTAMVLEDSALLAMDAEDILLELGFGAVEVVGNVTAALDVLKRLGGGLAFALLDVNLSDHTSLPVAAELLRRGIPFAFATGYGKKLKLPPDLAAAAMVIPKPYRRQDIAELLGRSLGSVRSGAKPDDVR